MNGLQYLSVNQGCFVNRGRRSGECGGSPESARPPLDPEETEVDVLRIIDVLYKPGTSLL